MPTLALFKQAEEEQDMVDALLTASGYDADAAREGGGCVCSWLRFALLYLH